MMFVSGVIVPVIVVAIVLAVFGLMILRFKHRERISPVERCTARVTMTAG